MADTEDLKSSESPTSHEGSSPSSGISDLIWNLQFELGVYHNMIDDCPRKRKCFCRICDLIDKATEVVRNG